MAEVVPEDAGNVRTWTALDADSKLIVSYLIVSVRLRTRPLRVDGYQAGLCLGTVPIF